MPVAINLGITICARIADSESRMTSAEMGEGVPFDARSVVPWTEQNWTKFAAGMAWVLREEGYEVPNIIASVSSDLPIGSGISSSAAIELAFGKVFCHLGGFDIDEKRLALLAQKCENHYVGVNCGIMDQMASSCGRANQAMIIDTRAIEITYAEVPSEYAVLLLDTQKPRALVDSEYNARRNQVESAARILGVPFLRDATLELLEQHKSKLSKDEFKRAKHVITENTRTVEFKTVLSNRDEKGIFALMKGSHDSLRDDFEVSCPELDAMSEAAWMSPGVVGARMTGAGFGGACVALVHQDQVEAFRAKCLALYQEKTARIGSILVCSVGAGARVISSN